MNKIINSFLMFGLMISTFTGIHAIEEIEPTDIKADEQREERNSTPSVSEFIIYQDENKEYLNHEEISFYVKVNLASGNDISKDVTIDINLPLDEVDVASIVTTDMSNQKSVTIIKNEYSRTVTIRYVFDSIIEGVSMSIPVKFRTKQGATPNNHILAVNASIKNHEGVDILEATSYEFKINTQSIKMDPTISRSTVQNRAHNGGIEHASKPGFLSEDLDSLEYVSFSAIVNSQNYNTKLGTRDFEKVIFTHKLAEDAVFIQEANEGWTYDEEDHTATYVEEYKYQENIGYKNFNDSVSLMLKFPNAPVNKTFTHNVIVSLVPHNQGVDEAETVISKSIRFSLSAKKSYNFNINKEALTKTVLDTQLNREHGQLWTVTLENDKSSSTAMTQFKITDTIDQKGFVSLISLQNNSNITGTVKIIGISENEEIVLYSNVDLSQEGEYPIAEGYKYNEIIVESDSKVNIPANNTFEFDVRTEVRNVERSLTGTNSVYFFKNNVSATASYDANKAVIQRSGAQVKYDKLKPQISFTDTFRSVAEVYTPYETIRQEMSLKGTHLVDDMSTLNLQQALVLLPKGMSYKKGSANLTVPFYVKGDNIKIGYIEPNIIENFEGTLQTALVWNLGDLTNLSENYQFTDLPLLSIKYETYFTEMADKGNHTIDTYLMWDRHDEIDVKTTERENPFDTYGVKNGMVLFDDKELAFMPAKELVLRKEVKGSMDDDFVLYPKTGSSEFGDKVDFRLTLLNNSVDDIDTIHILDILPHVEDLTVSSDISKNNERVSRGSTLSLTLNGPISAPEGYEVYYNDTADTEDMRTYYNDSGWTKEVDDYSSVKSIKIVLLDNYILESEDMVSFEMSLTVPKEMNDLDLNKAVNTFGAATSNGLVFFESNFATLDIHTYTVDGFVFYDTNRDGLHDLVDTFKDNHVIEVLDGEGNVVQTMDQEFLKQVTNKDGYFKFKIANAGDYKLRVSIPDGYEATKYMDTSNGSTINNAGVSKTFSLDKANKHVRINARFQREIGRLEVHKTLKDTLGNSFINDQEFTFKVSFNDQAYQGEVVIHTQTGDVETVTVSDGLINMKSGETFNIYDVEKDTTYKVEEIPTDGFTALEDTFEGVLNDDLVTLEFENQVVMRTMDYEVVKVWEDDFQNHPTIMVQLYRNGIAFGDVVTLENGSVEYTWKDLEAVNQYGIEYTYTVDEVVVPENYIKEVNDNVITNTYVEPKDETPTEDQDDLNKEEVKDPKPSEDKELPNLEEAKTPATGISSQSVVFIHIILLFSILLVFLRIRKPETH